jgi:hypothetical protein
VACLGIEITIDLNTRSQQFHIFEKDNTPIGELFLHRIIINQAKVEETDAC